MTDPIYISYDNIKIYFLRSVYHIQQNKLSNHDCLLGSLTLEIPETKGHVTAIILALLIVFFKFQIYLVLTRKRL